MNLIDFVYDDGGRGDAGYRGSAGDCVTRAIAIVTGVPYKDVYSALAKGAGQERGSRGASARNGIRTTRKWFKEYAISLGLVWTPTMKIGQGCKVHLVASELPPGRLVVAVSKHYTAVIDGVIHDTHNPSERGVTVYPVDCPLHLLPKGAVAMPGGGWKYEPQRCVYGYWKQG